MSKKSKPELRTEIERLFPDPQASDLISTPEQVLWYVQQLQYIYQHPDQRIKEILKDWAIHSWHLMHDRLDAEWRNDWPFRICHHLATISKHYELPTAPPSKGMVLTFERRIGFGSDFSNGFQRSDFVIEDVCSGEKIGGEELMREVVRRLEREIVGLPGSDPKPA